MIRGVIRGLSAAGAGRYHFAVVGSERDCGMIVDVHTHLWESPEQLGPEPATLLRARVTRPWERPDATPTDHDEAMTPVSRALVLGFVSRRLGANVPAKWLADYVATSAGRFIGLAGIDPGEDQWKTRLDEACALGLRGVVISPAAQGYPPTHAPAMRLYEECQKRGLPVAIESLADNCPSAMLEYAQPVLFDAVLRSFPDLRVLFTGLDGPWAGETLTLLAKHRYAYATFSGLVNRPWSLYQTLLAARERGVLEKLLLGSGFPASTPERTIAAVLGANAPAVVGLPTVPRQDLEAVVHRDALTCLGLAAPAPGLSALPRAGGTRSTSTPVHEVKT
jgi:uncharacterized protein